MSKQVADALVETLQAAGVKTCYGIVGDMLNRIAHAIDRSEIDWVHMRHEEAGAFAAGAEAQLTGHLTACAGTGGSSSLHLIMASMKPELVLNIAAMPAGSGAASRLTQQMTAS
jgi:pyruvate dehydrogenase (quinone)